MSTWFRCCCFKQKAAYEVRISGWSSDVVSSDLLTETGRLLARRPIDPRLARMILAAADQQCLDEMLIIASALSVQDPRDRPMQERDASEAAHAKFKDEKSEFLSFVKLWRWYAGQVAHKASQRKLVALLRQN